jgi:predicted nucleic acid-binding protein
MPPRDLLLDASVLIDALRGHQLPPVRQHRPAGRLWLSSVALAEAYAGTRSADDRRRLDDFVQPLIADGRLIAPSHEDWVRAGRLIARRIRLFGYVRPRDHLNDVLILLSAARHGAGVVTANVGHFEAWARLTRAGGLTVEVVPAAPGF